MLAEKPSTGTAAEHGREAGAEHVGGAGAEHGHPPDVAGADPRLVGRPAIAAAPGLTHSPAGVQQGAVREPRSFLRPDPRHEGAAEKAVFATHEHDFHTHLVRDFTPGELRTWRGGEWRNEWHYGRRGWWWQVGGVWYGYPVPIFPFPLSVAALATYDTPQIDGPNMAPFEEDAGPAAGEAPQAGASPGSPANAASQASGAFAGLPNIPPLPSPPPGTYHCDEPNGPWPEVDGCSQGWQLVAATEQPQ